MGRYLVVTITLPVINSSNKIGKVTCFDLSNFNVYSTVHSPRANVPAVSPGIPHSLSSPQNKPPSLRDIMSQEQKSTSHQTNKYVYIHTLLFCCSL